MHRHTWKITSQVTQRSAFELLSDAGQITRLRGMPDNFFVQRVVVTYVCSVCGSEKVERV